MSYQLSRLDLVVNNATTQITVNTNPSTQGYINGDVVPQDNIINIATTVNRFAAPDDLPAATILSISKAPSLTNLTATEVGIVNVPISATVEGNGLKNLFTNYYDGITYSPQLLTCVGANSTSTTIEDLSTNNFTFTNNGTATTSSFAPFPSSYAYSSVLFDGTAQSLTTTVATGSSLDLATGNGNWTIECWFNMSTITGTRTLFCKGGLASTNNPSYAFTITAGSGTAVVGDISGGSGGVLATSPTTVLANTWYHYALVRSGNIVTSYLNGIAGTPVVMTLAMTNTTNNLFAIGKVADGGTNFFPGYISNFRVVKGTALYLGNFAPTLGNFLPISVTTLKTKVSTAASYTKLTYVPLDIKLYNNLKYTAPTGQTEVYDKNVTVNSYTTAATSNINIISSTKTMNVASRPDFYITGSDAPNILSSDTTAITSSLGGSFNGTTSNLTLNAANGGRLDLSTLDTWTVECWFYATSVTGSRSIFWKGEGSPNNPSYALWLNAATPQWIVGDTGVSGYAYSQNLPVVTINTWYHFALVRNGDFVTAYINGVGSTPVAITYSGPTLNSTLWIGAAVDGRYFSGYISNFRVVKGTAVYINNFTVPTTPLTSNNTATINSITGTQTVLLLSTTNDGNYLKDSSVNNFTLTNTNSVIASSIGPTWTSGSTSSLQFSGTNYLYVNTLSASILPSENFTIEFWFYATGNFTLGNEKVILGIGNSGTIILYNSTVIKLSYSLSGPVSSTGKDSKEAVTLNQWHHLALVKEGSYISTYLDGINIIKQTANELHTINSITVGARSDGGVPFTGYISNIRVVKGVAVYTSSFIPPNMPLAATQNASTTMYPASLLTLQNAVNINDNSQFANTITPVSVSTLIPYSVSVPSYITSNTGPYYISTPSTPAYIRNTTKYNDPTQVEGYFNSFISEHTGEEDRVQAWV